MSQKTQIPLDQIAAEDFLSIGLDHIAYIRKNLQTDLYGLYAANGHLIFEAKDRQEAAFLAQQNNLLPVTVQ